MMINNLWFENYSLVYTTRISTFYQNELLSKKSIFTRKTQCFKINHQSLSCTEFNDNHNNISNYKNWFKIKFCWKL